MGYFVLLSRYLHNIEGQKLSLQLKSLLVDVDKVDRPYLFAQFYSAVEKLAVGVQGHIILVPPTPFRFSQGVDESGILSDTVGRFRC